ncbi:uncharacterized protein LOC114183431 isoform X2 [Vigna unguiculata]|uniref:uncharacterized protein LOC114183431 isoform X2 n=1 Tax=Vigna unguiculata TaxID=3917 RepID=UPI0010169F87|nr:uncharacterized protein LOC114183431 isoform X2 [Vigna unguiculata]XP_027926254.1 uncharacterized protein LOC114183431 isoform X2 [Vigna unguiculata]
MKVMNQLFEEYNKSWLFFCHEGRLMIYLKNTTKVIFQMNDVQVSRWMKCLKNIAKMNQLFEEYNKCWFFFSVMKDGFAKSMICFKNTTKVFFQMNDVQVSRWMKCLKNITKVENFVLLFAG